MRPIADILEERVSAAMAAAVGGAVAGPAALVRPSQDERFGDYQANGVMALAKQVGQKPRPLAEKVAAALDVDDMCERPEVAGPGFINLRLKAGWLAARLTEAIKDRRRLGVDHHGNPPTTVVDFSGPNIAKEMHVGHLRSTIIGDVIAQVLSFWYGAPEKVIRQNHVGDWGTQFGMLINYLDKNCPPGLDGGGIADAGRAVDAGKEVGAGGAVGTAWADLDIADMEALYRQAKKCFDEDEGFADESRQWVVRLHEGDEAARGYWNGIREQSLRHCEAIYEMLHVALGRADVRGESFYDERLPGVITELRRLGLLRESDGAQCVFLEGFRTKQGDPLPLIVQKSDGAYLYATTDLAALQFRVNELQARRIIYVTDARQKLHFEMIFACARRAGWAGDEVSLEHVPFGSVLGADGRPFKTRSGRNVKLKDLLAEAVERARQVVEEKNPDLPAEQKRRIARVVGIGAVKYADLSNNLVSDYVFDWDRMLALEGNTAPYMQYAYARVQSIFRKGGVDEEALPETDDVLELTEPAEVALAKLLLRYGEVVEAVARDLRPHLLTNYLFELAQAFSGFYTVCPVLQAPEQVRRTRLLLCHQTARTLRHGLGLLGIETIEQM